MLTKTKAAFMVLFLLASSVAMAGDVGTSTRTTTAAVSASPVIAPSDDLAIIPELVRLASLAFTNRQWMLLAGLLLTLLVMGLRFFKTVQKIPEAWIPWVVLAIAAGTSAALGLQTGQSLYRVVTTALGVGVTAIGGWESFAKAARALWRKYHPLPDPPVPPSGG